MSDYRTGKKTRLEAGIAIIPGDAAKSGKEFKIFLRDLKFRLT